IVRSRRLAEGERACSYSPWDPGQSGSYSVPHASHDHRGNVVAGSVREGRRRRTVLRGCCRGWMGREENRGMAPPSEPCDIEGDCDSRSLAGTLHPPRLPERVWNFDDAEGLLELCVRRGLGALLRGDDAGRRVRGRAVTVYSVEGGFVEGLQVHCLLQDAHSRNDTGRGATVHHEKCAHGSGTC